MEDILKLLGRKQELFYQDVIDNETKILQMVSNSSFIVIGGAGSIGTAVTKEIFKRNPKKLHVVDINENRLTELVRDIRSQYGYISGEFKTFSLDVGSFEYDAFIKADGQYDYVLNLSALKHVRSEKDPYTLMRMINVNIINTIKTIEQSITKNTKKYFCVSTDKATYPINMMGASKYIMEMFLMSMSKDIKVSTARFANVAFSDGSLLDGFKHRIEKMQPLAAPYDIKRYFLTPKESGELCLLSCILGENKSIFFPRLEKSHNLLSFSDLAIKFLKSKNYEPYICQSEEEARKLIHHLPKKGKWPCFFSKSDTTGEKEIEEFHTKNEILEKNNFINIGVFKNNLKFNDKKLDTFKKNFKEKSLTLIHDKKLLVKEFKKLIPNFDYIDKRKYLDGKM